MALKMMDAIYVPDEAFPYLVLQRGALDDMKGDAALWMNKYCEVITDEFQCIEPFLPPVCESILDIGSGLGGIDALINAHYGGGCRVTLVDGVDDPPRMALHRKTFNHMGVARRFLALNGVDHFSHIDANDAHRTTLFKYDLIVSFRSWCFHVEPAAHLDLAIAGCRKGTILIIDVRRDKPAWAAELARAFTFVREAYRGPKTITGVYEYAG